MNLKKKNNEKRRKKRNEIKRLFSGFELSSGLDLSV